MNAETWSVVRRSAMSMVDSCLDLEAISPPDNQRLLEFVTAWPATARRLDEASHEKHGGFMAYLTKAYSEAVSGIWAQTCLECASVALEHPVRWAQGLMVTIRDEAGLPYAGRGD